MPTKRWCEAASTEDQDIRAAREVVAELRGQLAGAAPRALFVFTTDDRDHAAVLAVAREEFGPVTVVGGSSPALLARGTSIRDGVAMLASADPGIEVSCAVAEGAAGDSVGAGARAASASMAGLAEVDPEPSGDRAALLVLSDGIRANSVDVVRGVVETAGRDLRLFGGGMGDDLRFVASHQFTAAGAHSGAVVAACFVASGPIGVALRHGCVPWGPPMHVSASSDRVLRTLDFEPAFSRYCDTVSSLGERPPSADEFMQFAMLHPIGIVQGHRDHVLRSPLQATAEGSILCCSDVPPNALVRLMRGTPESLIAAARQAGEEARRQLGDRRPAAALVFACVSRDVALGSRDDGPSRELDAVREGIGADIPILGCLTFGGFGALSSGLSQYHSKSVSVCVLPEDEPTDA
jgi:hypothetical protein